MTTTTGSGVRISWSRFQRPRPCDSPISQAALKSVPSSSQLDLACSTYGDHEDTNRRRGPAGRGAGADSLRRFIGVEGVGREDIRVEVVGVEDVDGGRIGERRCVAEVPEESRREVAGRVLRSGCSGSTRRSGWPRHAALVAGGRGSAEVAVGVSGVRRFLRCRFRGSSARGCRFQREGVPGVRVVSARSRSERAATRRSAESNAADVRSQFADVRGGEQGVRRAPSDRSVDVCSVN